MYENDMAITKKCESYYQNDEKDETLIPGDAFLPVSGPFSEKYTKQLQKCLKIQKLYYIVASEIVL